MLRRVVWVVFSVPTFLGTGCGTNPPPIPAPLPSTPFQQADWQYPGATRVVFLGGADVSANDGRGGTPRVVDRTPQFEVSTSPDPLETVFGFYAKRLGVSPDYEPGKTETASTTPVTMTDTRAGIDPIIIGSIAHAGRPLRENVRSATLVKHDPAADVVVILSRGEGEDLTTIELVVIERPRR
ncbi:MAG: hypothetical protein AB7I30_17400 [Isosphaeraceae bacterium]